MKYINDPETVARAKNGDRDAMDAVVESNMGLVRSIAVRFNGRGVEQDDLMQLGAIGLIKAICGFDPSFGCSFSTYAVPLIMGEIKRYLRDDGIIKISRTVKRNAALIRRFCDEYMHDNSREPTVDEISEGCGIAHEDIVIALDAARPMLSLCSSGDDDTGTLEEIVGEDVIEKRFEDIALRQAIEKLDRRDKLLIKLRYYRGLTQQKTAELLGMSQVKVSREERRIQEKLRRCL